MPRQKTETENNKSLLLRLPEPLLEACRARAKKDRRSLNQQLLTMLEGCINETKEKKNHELVGSRDN